MADISAALVKQLRDRTGAGMMDCKRALQESGGDLEAAARLLREQGVVRAAKRAGRETTEGKVGYRIQNGTGAIVAVGCETEPVSNNEEFLAYAVRVLEAVERDGEEGWQALEGERVELVAKIGENVEVVGARRLEASDGDVIEGYAHPPANKVGVLVQVEGGSPEAAKELAMHISWGAPRWLSREDVPGEEVEREREIFLGSDEVQSKPEQAREKIVDGMLNKRFFAERGNVLLDQPWIREPSKTVAQALQEEGMRVIDFARLSVAD